MFLKCILLHTQLKRTSEDKKTFQPFCIDESKYDNKKQVLDGKTLGCKRKTSFILFFRQ